MRDLFGLVPDPPPASGPVTVRMVLHDRSDRAWLLAPDLDRRKAKWVPMSQAVRGEGPDENMWTMPAWMARERGWI